MQISKQSAAEALARDGAHVGEEVAVSTSEYNDMGYFREVADRYNQRVIYANVQTMRSFAKRGLISWDQRWRSGNAILLDIEGLRKIAEGEK